MKNSLATFCSPIIIITAFMLCGCSHTRRVSPEKFETEFYKAKAFLQNSIADYSFAGVNENGKVYLHKEHMSLLAGMLFMEIYYDRIYISDYYSLNPKVKKEIREIMVKKLKEIDK